MVDNKDDMIADDTTMVVIITMAGTMNKRNTEDVETPKVGKIMKDKVIGTVEGAEHRTWSVISAII